MFKNLRVATRLYLCFSAVIAVFIITIVVMAINFKSVVESNNWNIHTYKVLMACRDITASLINMETGHRGFLLTGDENFLEPYNSGIKAFSEHYDIGKSLTSDNPKQQERFEKLLSEKNSLVDDFMVPLIDDKKNGIDITNEKLGSGKEYMDGIRATLSELAGAEEELLTQRSSDLKNLISLNLILELLLGGISIFLSMLLSILLARSISKQLGCEPSDVAYISGKIADGDLNFNLNIDTSKPNGAFANILRMVASLKEKGAIINRIAEGNLTDQVNLASENDNLGKALAKMLESLNQILTQVSMAISQFGTGTEQISEASQSLSQGASEQASSLEEITSSVNVINGRSKDNSRNSEQAQIMANQAKEAADTGYMQMKEVVSSMKEINKSAEGIKRIAKTIDDIASQINLLALNANVEAARAGEYGRGFAVVADEVRNLASRSANSVKGATELVEEAIKNITTGNKLAELTSNQIESIVTIATNVSAIATEVTSASIEQSQELNQISLGLDQIDKVTQANTAIFEETAAASKDLAKQALELKVLMSKFKISN